MAAKHGVVGVMHALANELAESLVRVNTLHPTGVRTPMGDGLHAMPDLLAERPELGSLLVNSLPIERTEARDIANAVLFLVSDESRHVTGLQMTVGVVGYAHTVPALFESTVAFVVIQQARSLIAGDIDIWPAIFIKIDNRHRGAHRRHLGHNAI